MRKNIRSPLRTRHQHNMPRGFLRRRRLVTSCSLASTNAIGNRSLICSRTAREIATLASSKRIMSSRAACAVSPIRSGSLRSLSKAPAATIFGRRITSVMPQLAISSACKRKPLVRSALRLSEWAAKLYADIRSVIETARRRAVPALNAIRLTLDGQPLPIATWIGPSPACRSSCHRA
jgi:hypothetical protein